jgi:hypothetical protein
MELKINIRGNGACPLCRKRTNCLIIRKILHAVSEFKENNGTGMELAIYTCPAFIEKV